MAGKKKVRSHSGWILAEVLCSVIIVSMASAQIIDVSGMMARALAKGMEIRTRTLDFSSIAADHMSRGSWNASVETCACDKSICRAEVSVSLNSGEDSDTIRWIAWDIRGRAR